MSGPPASSPVLAPLALAEAGALAHSLAIDKSVVPLAAAEEGWYSTCPARTEGWLDTEMPGMLTPPLSARKHPPSGHEPPCAVGSQAVNEFEWKAFRVRKVDERQLEPAISALDAHFKNPSKF